MADGARLAWTAGEEEVFWTEVMYDGTFGLKLRCNSWAKYAAKMQEKMIARTGSKDMLPRDYTEKNCSAHYYRNYSREEYSRNARPYIKTYIERAHNSGVYPDLEFKHTYMLETINQYLRNEPSMESPSRYPRRLAREQPGDLLPDGEADRITEIEERNAEPVSQLHEAETVAEAQNQNDAKPAAEDNNDNDSASEVSSKVSVTSAIDGVQEGDDNSSSADADDDDDDEEKKKKKKKKLIRDFEAKLEEKAPIETGAPMPPQLGQPGFPLPSARVILPPISSLMAITHQTYALPSAIPARGAAHAAHSYHHHHQQHHRLQLPPLRLRPMRVRPGSQAERDMHNGQRLNRWKE